ncbi:MAG TPA: V-type ATP synthase subunit D [Candidatus Norongarragalinales archaeon]|nr:V-type ATP synthase subunit D [Candidatus Norongarragalinales archaeon]
MAKESVKPTRMEMLNTKGKLRLAEKGHKLLKQKRDALVFEFFSIVKKAKDMRLQLDRQLISAYRSLAVAEAMHSRIFLETAALASQEVPKVQVSSKNIMGVRIPAIQGVSIQRTLLQRGYSLPATSASFDECVDSFEKSLDLIIKIAETETALKRLLTEIEKTNRRVNALEFNIQPDLKRTIKEIQGHLNRLEAELFFSLKVTKRRLEKKAQAEESGEAV